MTSFSSRLLLARLLEVYIIPLQCTVAFRSRCALRSLAHDNPLSLCAAIVDAESLVAKPLTDSSASIFVLQTVRPTHIPPGLNAIFLDYLLQHSRLHAEGLSHNDAPPDKLSAMAHYTPRSNPVIQACSMLLLWLDALYANLHSDGYPT